jgi:hypothetical protein
MIMSDNTTRNETIRRKDQVQHVVNSSLTSTDSYTLWFLAPVELSTMIMSKSTTLNELFDQRIGYSMFSTLVKGKVGPVLN